MSIYLNKDSKVIVQGITGGEGTKHTKLMLKAGTQVVGGVNARNARDYLAQSNVMCVGGTWMVDAKAVRAGDWAAIEARAREASGLR